MRTVKPMWLNSAASKSLLALSGSSFCAAMISAIR